MRTHRSALVAAAAMLCATMAANAASQNSRRELVPLLARYNRATMALVKRYAEDDSFARRLQQLTTARDYDAIADAVVDATGIPRNEITVVAAVPGSDGAGLGVVPSRELGAPLASPELRRAEGHGPRIAIESAGVALPLKCCLGRDYICVTIPLSWP